MKDKFKKIIEEIKEKIKESHLAIFILEQKERLTNAINAYLEEKFHHKGNKNILKSKIKIKIYTLLGAEIFQKVVFKVEKIKYIIMEKFFPNSYDFLEKVSDKDYVNKQKRKHYEDPQTRREYILEKLKYRKELVTSQNRNYHYNPESPTECIGYLKKNKEIHERGLKCNLILLLIIFVCSNILTSIPTVYIIMGYLLEIFSLFINFQCINLQNYNLERLENEKTIELLKKKEEIKINNDLKNYRQCSKVVSSKLMSSMKVPTVKDVTSEIKTSEQAQELRVMAARRLSYLESLKNEKKLRRK